MISILSTTPPSTKASSSSMSLLITSSPSTQHLANASSKRPRNVSLGGHSTSQCRETHGPRPTRLRQRWRVWRFCGLGTKRVAGWASPSGALDGVGLIFGGHLMRRMSESPRIFGLGLYVYGLALRLVLFEVYRWFEDRTFIYRGL